MACLLVWWPSSEGWLTSILKPNAEVNLMRQLGPGLRYRGTVNVQFAVIAKAPALGKQGQ